MAFCFELCGDISETQCPVASSIADATLIAEQSVVIVPLPAAAMSA